MIKAIAFTAYSVSDLKRARQFYEGILGLTPSESTSDFWQEYDLENGTFGIGAAPDSAPDYYKNRGSSLAFEVEDLDAALEKVKQHNVTILQEPMNYPACRMFVISDPDNNVIFMHQLTKK
jgi:predicted enzyme related to lactoylglutathione lyase